MRRVSRPGTAPACMGGSGLGAPGAVTFNSANPTEGDCGSQKQWSPEPPVHWCRLLAVLVDLGVWRRGPLSAVAMDNRGHR